MKALLNKISCLLIVTAFMLLFNQFAFILLHNHSEKVIACHQDGFEAVNQLHKSESAETCTICSLLTLKDFNSIDNKNLNFHPYIRVFQTRRLFTFFVAPPTTTNSRASPAAS